MDFKLWLWCFFHIFFFMPTIKRRKFEHNWKILPMPLIHKGTRIFKPQLASFVVKFICAFDN